MSEQEDHQENQRHDSEPTVNIIPKPAVEWTDQQGCITWRVYHVCFLPYFVCFTVVAVCPDWIDAQLMTTVTWIGYLNSTLNPFLYPLCNATFRQKFRRMLGCMHASDAELSIQTRYGMSRVQSQRMSARPSSTFY